MTASLRDIKVYTTYPHSCSYLEDQEAVTLFVDPKHTVDKALYSSLSGLGFRRSGSHIYRPHCEACNACIPSRIPVAEFRMSRGQRRTWNRNQDLVVEESETIIDDAAYQLYTNYIEMRHKDGDMYPPVREQYESFLNNPWQCTRYYRFYLPENGQQTLVAIAVADFLDDGQSAIYTFFDPTQEKRSLGTYTILWQVDNARNSGLNYLYLGYWIRNCQKMSYKTSYRPLELRINNSWSAV
ncbi:MAG: arginyltransferase [Proteobacteria bacterium]|nr:arginyltransferase [Pseudomonadota bacterium]